MTLRRIESMAVLGAATLMLVACGPVARTVLKSGDDLAAAVAKTGKAVPPPPGGAAASHADAEAAGARETGSKVGQELVEHGVQEGVDQIVSGDEQE